MLALLMPSPNAIVATIHCRPVEAMKWSWMAVFLSARRSAFHRVRRGQLALVHSGVVSLSVLKLHGFVELSSEFFSLFLGRSIDDGWSVDPLKELYEFACRRKVLVKLR
jgi:hypothetical protein